MEDMVIKGTGNSRWLKSVANIMTLYPTYESFAEALAAGTFPIDLNGINPAGVETPGTRLNKANLLTDALCTALGLATTATPTQAMEALRQLINTVESNAVKFDSGYYTGNGSSSRYVYLPFYPAVVFVFRNDGATHYYANESQVFGGLAVEGSGVEIGSSSVVSISSNRIYCANPSTYTGANLKGWTYNYVAFG